MKFFRENFELNSLLAVIENYDPLYLTIILMIVILLLFLPIILYMERPDWPTVQERILRPAINGSDADAPNQPDREISTILEIQFSYNSRNNTSIPYNGFPFGHPAHLNLRQREKLVDHAEFLPVSFLLYRMGSSRGSIYLRRTYTHPKADLTLIITIRTAEWLKSHNGVN